jgi:hypothetical protein
LQKSSYFIPLARVAVALGFKILAFSSRAFLVAGAYAKMHFPLALRFSVFRHQLFISILQLFIFCIACLDLNMMTIHFLAYLVNLVLRENIVVEPLPP